MREAFIVSTKKIHNIDTPALLLDVNKMEKNILDIVQFAKKYDVSYRPHIKSHKSIDIAKKQMNFGAIGITVATVGEAEVMSNGGIKDILIAYPISASIKLKQIKKIMQQSKITVAVDSAEQASLLQEFFKGDQQVLNVWIKVNSGLNRCGVEPNEVVELANHISQLSALSLNGLFTHAGHSYAATTEKEIDDIAKKEAEVILKSVEMCEAVGIDIHHRSIGSTPTFKKAGKITGITEIRPGNAVFYDMIQVGLNVVSLEQCALTVLSTVGSKQSNRIVIDAGSKTLNLDKGAHGNESVSGHGFIKEYPELVIERLSEEHGIIPIKGEIDVKITDQLTIIPNHACTVVNLFDSYIIHRNGEIIDEWEIQARGRID